MPPKKPPLAPAALTAQAVSPTEIHLRWVDRANNEARVGIERAIGEENFVAIAEVTKNVTEFDARQLTPETRYRFRVRAFNNYGSSAYSNLVTITTPAVSVPPVEPQQPPPSEPPPIVIPPVEPPPVETPPIIIPPPDPLPPLTASDLAFAHLRADGVFALPNTGLGVDISFGRGALAGRVVDGQVRLFIHGKEGDFYPILEMTPPAVLHQSLAAAVAAPLSGRAAVVHNWGTAVYGATQDDVKDTWQEAGASWMNYQVGLCYANGKLFYSLSHSYNTNNTNDRHVGYAELDTPAVGSCVQHGPWRTPFGPQVCAGRLFAIPRDLALQYFGGRTLGIGAATISGTAGAPFGISFVTISEPSLALTPDDRLDVNDISLTDAVIAARCTQFTRMNMARFSVRRKVCGWQDPGAHAQTTADVPPGATSIPVADTALYGKPGSSAVWLFYAYVNGTGGPIVLYAGTSTPSGPGFLTGVPASGYGSIETALPSGTGLVLGNYDVGRGGTLRESDGTWGPVAQGSTDVAVYYDYPGPQTFIRTQSGKQGFLMLASLCDTVPGVDYGDHDTCDVWYGAGRICPHGQTASTFNTSPGPKAASTVPWGLLFRLSEIAEVQDGARTIGNLAPYDAARLHDLAPLMPSPEGRETVAGCWFDDVHNDLYVSVLAQDTQSIWGLELPLIHRFHVIDAV